MVKNTEMFKGKIILSPMAGFTNVEFRALCKKYGADITLTEFVSAAAIVRDNKRTFEMLVKDDSEKPMGVQIFGGKVEELINAAKILEKDFDFIDLNCGCPAPKVTKNAAGSELLNDSKKIYEILKGLVENVNLPITVKVRICPNIISIAKLAEKAGVSAIAVHGRTREQRYTGHANWNVIRKIKKAVNIPVIGNGDIENPEIAKKRFDVCNVNSLMVGRAALRNPHIFAEIKDYLEKGSYEQLSRKEIFSDFLEFANNYKTDIKQIRSFALHLSKGIEGGADLRRKIPFMNKNELKTLFESLNL